MIRWTVAAFLEIEPMLKTISNARYLKVLKFKMQEEIKKQQEKKYKNSIEDGIMELMLI